ncbi:MAG: ATP-binding cassette domain-containing protein [Hyphomicrobiales bacterium]
MALAKPKSKTASILWSNRFERLGLATGRYLRIGPSVVLMSSVINILSLLMPLSILIVYDRIVPNAAYESLAMLVAMLIGFAVAEAALRVCRAYVLGWSAAKFELQTTLLALNKILTADYSSLNSVPPVRQAERLKAVSRYADFMGNQSRLALIDLPYVVLFLTVMALIGGWLAIVPIVVISIFSVVILLLSGRYRRVLEERKSQDTKIYDFIAELLVGIHTVKGSSMESQMLRRFERLQRGGCVTDFQSIEVAARSQTLMGLFGNTTIIAMVTTGGWLAATGELSVGTLAACTMLAGRTIQPVVRVAGIWNELQRTAIAHQDIEELFLSADGPKTRKLERGSPIIGHVAPIAVHAQDVAIERGGRPLIEAINFDLKPGEFMGIEGPDGEGKSTLMRVLSGDIPPLRGTLLANGNPVGEAIRETNRIALASAGQGLFTGTILDNLTLFGDGSSVENARWAVDLIGLRKSIDALPLGFDTVVGNSANTALASGFIQRIILARALAQRPGLLILDEPQAFLDNDADRDVLAGLISLKGTTTIIMATNRPSYLRLAEIRLKVLDGVLVPVDDSGVIEPNQVGSVA